MRSKNMYRELYLEHMKCFKLDVATPVLQKIHHQLQVIRTSDVPRHDGKVGPVQQNFSQKL
jgi:hypothetical protein